MQGMVLQGLIEKPNKTSTKNDVLKKVKPINTTRSVFKYILRQIGELMFSSFIRD